MKKNLFNQRAVEKMIKRVSQLNSNSVPKWGEMTATEMLLHCNLCNNQILNSDVEDCKPSFKKKLIKYLALYIVPSFPKNMKSAEKNITHGKIENEQFDKEKESFIETLKSFTGDVLISPMPHPAFGMLSKTEWGRAAWKHTDHHLRQFGL